MFYDNNVKVSHKTFETTVYLEGVLVVAFICYLGIWDGSDIKD